MTSSSSSTSSLTSDLLPLPAELVRQCVGLSIDIGCSMLKIILRSRQNLEDVANKEAKVGHLELISFAREDLEKGLEYIKRNAALGQHCTTSGNQCTTKGNQCTTNGNQCTTNSNQQEIIITTGVGCSQYNKLISETLNIRIKNESEFRMFPEGFRYLASRLSRNQFLHDYDAETGMKQYDIQRQKCECRAAAGWHINSPLTLDMLGRSDCDSTLPLAQADDNVYPCILAMCGSGFLFTKLYKDGTFEIRDSSERGGKSFFGLGSLLTGCKSFSELIQLAEQGDDQMVSTYTETVAREGQFSADDDSIYANAARDLIKGVEPSDVLFHFARCSGANRETFRREDISSAFLSYFASDLIQTAFLNCVASNVSRVFFGGSVVNSSAVRRAITASAVRWNGSQWGTHRTIKFDFVKPGAHLGAFGAIISGH